ALAVQSASVPTTQQHSHGSHIPTPAAAQQAAPASRVPLGVRTDSSAHEITVEYQVSAMSGDHAHAGHEGHAGHVQRMVRFPAPITGWFRSARLELTGPDGQPIPQRALHHFNLLNLSRRQLVHGGVERMWAAGQETEA